MFLYFYICSSMDIWKCADILKDAGLLPLILLHFRRKQQTISIAIAAYGAPLQRIQGQADFAITEGCGESEQNHETPLKFFYQEVCISPKESDLVNGISGVWLKIPGQEFLLVYPITCLAMSTLSLASLA